MCRNKLVLKSTYLILFLTLINCTPKDQRSVSQAIDFSLYDSISLDCKSSDAVFSRLITHRDAVYYFQIYRDDSIASVYNLFSGKTHEFPIDPDAAYSHGRAYLISPDSLIQIKTGPYSNEVVLTLFLSNGKRQMFRGNIPFVFGNVKIWTFFSSTARVSFANGKVLIPIWSGKTRMPYINFLKKENQSRERHPVDAVFVINPANNRLNFEGFPGRYPASLNGEVAINASIQRQIIPFRDDIAVAYSFGVRDSVSIYKLSGELLVEGVIPSEDRSEIAMIPISAGPNEQREHYMKYRRYSKLYAGNDFMLRLVTLPTASDPNSIKKTPPSEKRMHLIF